MTIKTIFFAVGGFILMGCNDTPSSNNPLLNKNKESTQPSIRDSLNDTLHAIEKLSADAPIIVYRGGREYKLLPLEAKMLKNGFIRAIKNALNQSPIVTFDGLHSPAGYATATCFDSIIHIGNMQFTYYDVKGTAPFIIHRGAILQIRYDYFNPKKLK